MNKSIIVVGGVASALGLLWIYHEKQKAKPTLGIPSPTNSPGAKPRVDNQSQPWYTGALNWASTKEQQYKQNPGLVQSDLQSVVHSVSDVWGTVSGWFGGDNASTAANVDESPDPISNDPTSVNAYDLSLPAYDVDQSNMIGDQYADFGNQTMDVVLMNQDSSGDDWTLNSSDSEGLGSDNVA